MKGETSKGFGKFREETSKALDKLSKMIKGKETAQ
jgi:hypothetical protein